MKLTDSERRHLYDLTIATDRPKPATATLVMHGLAEQGAGKFGSWVRATAKGLALARSWSQEEQLRLMSSYTDSVVPSALKREHAPIPVDARNEDAASLLSTAGTTAIPRTSRQPVSPMLAAAVRSPRTQAPPRPLQQRAPIRPAIAAPTFTDSCAVTAKQQNKRNPTPTPSARPNGAAASGAPLFMGAAVENRAPPESKRLQTAKRCTAVPTSPNAVRIVVGTRATYYPYPLSGSAVHGTQCNVSTTNPFFRSLALEASERNDQVL